MRYLSNNKLFFLAIITLLIFSACSNKQRGVNIQLNWKSDDPLSIPLPVRDKEYLRGNLILNPSFETGRFLTIDSARSSFSLNSWSRLGENVHWTDIKDEELYKRNEASDGFHAIKIVRERADETDIQGEGVISDYIRVIPGNYSLTCDIRLENIESNMKRLSSNLLDAVNIRISYYDKNKILIRSPVYNPSGDNIIDNSFKAYSFSGYDYIKEFEWNRINCISNHYPYAEGDVPSDARFVRIFLGLKGTGTMWIDMVDFRYTRANFSLLEKCEPYFTDPEEPSSRLFPSPVSFSNYHRVDLISGTDEKPLYPVILVPRDFKESELLAVEQLKLALQEIIPLRNKRRIADIRVVQRLEEDALENEQLVFSIGNTSVFNENAEILKLQDLKEKSQGYIIKRLQHLGNIIFLYAENQESYFYAANQVARLLEISEGIYHHYDIYDYPAFETRGFIAKASNEKDFFQNKDLSDLLSVGLNRIYLAPVTENDSFPSVGNYFNNSKQYFKAFQSKFPYFQFGFSGLDLRYSGNFSDKSGNPNVKAIDQAARNVSDIINRINPVGEAGILISDKAFWESMRLGSPATSLKLTNIDHYNQFIEINNMFLRSLNKSVAAGLMDQYIYFHPVYSDNMILHKSGIYGRYYFKDYYFNDNDPEILLWQGPAEFSFSIDGSDLQRFSGESLKKIVWFDNTLMVRNEMRTSKGNISISPGKCRLGSFFPPFQVELFLPSEAFYNSTCIVNLPDFSPISRIRLSTAAEFLWNPDSYVPELSLWKILRSRFGKEAAIELIRFNDECHKLIYLTLTAEKDGLSPKLVREGEEFIRIINTSWEKVTIFLAADIPLLNQLTDEKNRVINRFNQTRRKRGRTVNESGGAVN